jgi:bile acid:Na+ symporter, BASS family
MVLAFLARHARWAMPSGLAVGLAWPSLAQAIAPILAASVVLLLLVSMLRVAPAAVTAAFASWRLLGIVWGWALLVCPFLALAIGKALGLPADLASALTVAAAAPPLLFGAMFAAVTGLNAGLALVGVVGGTLLGALTLPLVASGAGLDLGAVSMVAFLLRSLAVVVGTALAAWAIRRAMGPARMEAHKTSFEGMGVVLMIVFAVAVMDGVTALAVADPVRLATFVLAAFALNLALQLGTAGLFWRRGASTAATLAIVAGFRNNGLLFAILPPPIPPEIVLFIAAAQFPIYIVPSLFWSVYARAARVDQPPCS